MKPSLLSKEGHRVVIRQGSHPYVGRMVNIYLVPKACNLHSLSPVHGVRKSVAEWAPEVYLAHP